MRLRLLSSFAFVLLLSLSASCAKGTSGGLGGLGGSGAEGGSASTSSTVPSTTGSMSGTTSSSGTSTSTSSVSSSSGSTCPSPCKVTLPQCGCSGGDACTVENYQVTCSTPGPDAVNQACGTTTGDVCQAGGACVGASATVGQCLEFCDGDADCASFGGLCAIELLDGPSSTTTIPGVTLCSPGCNPLDNSGCPSGSKCDLGREQAGQQRWFGVCTSGGTKTQGQSCNPDAADCAPMYTCIDPDSTGSVCLKYCNADLLTGCSGAQSCYGLTDQQSQPIVLGSMSIGVCF
ncbi:Hypothetical protein A7982_09001 [Minicystis rosea]|nr:Hypothetical protein A7982_09001 [Minicystis rosea]